MAQLRTLWTCGAKIFRNADRPAIACSLNFHTSGLAQKDQPPAESTKAINIHEDEGWLRRLLHQKKIETPSKSQSAVLSDLESVYELQVHKVKPECMLNYIQEFEKFVDLMKKKDTGAKLKGSWTVLVGDQDEAIHLWKYKGGYPAFNKALTIYRTDKDILKFRLARNQMLRSRYNQLLLRFSFWDFVGGRAPGNLYELRSYTLKPGTNIEWGNNWARGLKFRKDNNEAVCGFFSHVGQLYQAHHLWAYKDLQARKETREAAWSKPGWDDTVRYTVPLIRELQTRILIPTPFSPEK